MELLLPSFTTLSGVGLGDVLPISPVVVSRLIDLRAERR